MVPVESPPPVALERRRAGTREAGKVGAALRRRAAREALRAVHRGPPHWEAQRAPSVVGAGNKAATAPRVLKRVAPELSFVLVGIAAVDPLKCATSPVRSPWVIPVPSIANSSPPAISRVQPLIAMARVSRRPAPSIVPGHVTISAARAPSVTSVAEAAARRRATASRLARLIALGAVARPSVDSAPSAGSASAVETVT